MTNFELSTKLFKELFILLAKAKCFRIFATWNSQTPNWIIKILDVFYSDNLNPKNANSKILKSLICYRLSKFYLNLASVCVEHLKFVNWGLTNVDDKIVKKCDSIFELHFKKKITESFFHRETIDKLFNLCIAQVKKEYKGDCEFFDDVIGFEVMDIDSINVIEYIKYVIKNFRKINNNTIV